MSKVFIEDTTLTAIGDAIRGKAGTSDLIDPANMAQEITNLPTGGGGGIDPSDLAFTGNLAYFNYNGTLDNLLTKYSAQCSFTNINNLNYTFAKSNGDYPITINGDINSNCDLSYCFNGSNFKQLPLIKNIKPFKYGGFLAGCHYITTIPDDYADTWDFTTLNSTTDSDTGVSCMAECYSLRKAPKFLKYLYTIRSKTSFNPYKGLLSGAYNIDEIIGYPCPPANFTTNFFGGNLAYLERIKNFTFDMLDENTPYTRNWTSQHIMFDNTSTSFGWSKASNHQLNYGFTEDTRITDDASYQLLKDNPDSWTTNVDYSRYNHDSAVRTINSLPDCSASGGTNTISFIGRSGSKTDGGAINTLTEEEIAVATAKGWTVSIS